MILNEIFGFGKKKDVHTLMQEVEEMVTHWGQYLHLAHTRRQYEENKEEFARGMEQFRQLHQRYEAGEDISAELEEFKKYVKPQIGNFGNPWQ